MSVDRTRIEALLGVDEHAELDHKRRVNLDERREVVELVKDIAAMMACGGDILIGTDDDGCISGDMDESLSRQFDEATLRDKVAKYLDPNFSVRVGVHKFAEGWVVCLRVEPSRDGIAVVRADGSYEIERGVTRKMTTVFRPGDVFVRHGSKSERWHQGDVRDFIARLREREKAQWLDEHAESSRPLLERQGEALARQLAHAAAPPLPEDLSLAANADAVPHCDGDEDEFFNLWMILQLGRIAELARPELRMIEVEYEEGLERGFVTEGFDWSNGETALSGFTWFYPNGKEACSAFRTLSWPTGKEACCGDAWNYPDGSEARSGDERWFIPGRPSDDLDDAQLRRRVREACTPAEWSRYEQGLDQLADDVYALALLELAWKRLRPSRV